MKIVAITGSIGCGKTYISKMIKSLGYSVINADKEVSLLYKKRSFLNIIKENFPKTFESGSFNKRTLRNIVFNDKNKLKKLEAIVHPLLKRVIKEKIRRMSVKNDLIFIDAALIFEMKWDKHCDYIILADVDKNIQKQRVMKRDNITEDDFNKIVSGQIDNEIKKQKSDFVINTELPDGIILSLLIKYINEVINA